MSAKNKKPNANVAKMPIKENKKSEIKIEKKTELIDPSVALSVKKILERLSYLYNQNNNLYEASHKRLFSKIAERQFKKIGDLVEMIYSHKILLNNCQMGLSSALFLSTSLETLLSLYGAHSKYKTDVRTCVKNNLKLFNTHESFSQEIVDLQTKKCCLEDEVEFYKQMWDIYYINEDDGYCAFESEIWQLLLTTQSDSILPSQLVNIDNFLSEDTTSQIEAMLKEYLEEGRTDEPIGLVILNLGKRCLYLGAIDVAIRIINQAIAMVKTIIDPRSVRFILLPIAVAFGHYAKNNKKEASKIFLSVANDINKIHFSNNFEKGYVSLLVGYFLLKWKEKELGFKILEQAVALLDNGLPQSEALWTKCVNVISRFYNECDKPDQAYNHLTKVIDYHHEKNHGPITNYVRPIYMVASEAKNISKASVKLMEILRSQTALLPPKTMTTIRELIVTFAIQGNMNAVGILEKYMNDCYATYKDYICYDETDRFDHHAILKMLKHPMKEGDLKKDSEDKSKKKIKEDLLKKKG